MEQQLTVLWKVLLWGLGVCVSGFLFLAGWMWWFVGQVRRSNDLKEDLDKIAISLKNIEIGMMGDFKEKGLISRVYGTESAVKDLHKRIGKLEGEKEKEGDDGG